MPHSRVGVDRFSGRKEDYPIWRADVDSAINVIVSEEKVDGGREARRAAAEPKIWYIVWMSLPKELKTLISPFRSEREASVLALEEIQKRYLGRSEGAILEARGELHQLVMQGDYPDYESKMVLIFHRLAAAGKEVPEAEKVAYLLNGINCLDSSWAPVVRECRGKEWAVTIRLLREWSDDLNAQRARQTSAQSRQATATALAVVPARGGRGGRGRWRRGRRGNGRIDASSNPDNRGRNGDEAREKKKQIVCYHCEKKGHMKKDCWQLHPEKKPKSKKQNGGEQAAAAVVSDLFEDGMALGLPVVSTTVASSTHTSIPRTVLLADTCATIHVLNSTFQSSFTELKDCEETAVQGLYAVGTYNQKGVAVLNHTINGKRVRLMLKDAVYIPDAPFSLLSIPRVRDKTTSDSREGKLWTFFLNNMPVLYAVILGRGIPPVVPVEIPDVGVVPTAEVSTTIVAALIDLTHQQLGHPALSVLQQLRVRGALEGFKAEDTLQPCQACRVGKMVRTSFPTPKFDLKSNESLGPMDELRIDLTGPIRPMGLGGFHYLGLVIDRASRRLYPLYLASKAQVFEKFLVFVTAAENALGRKPKTLITDNGTEVSNSQFTTWCQEKGVHHGYIVPYNSPQNGLVERPFQTVFGVTRTMLAHASMPKYFWPEASRHSIFLINRRPHSGLGGEIPEFAWNGSIPVYRSLRVFGCRAWRHIPKEQRTKLDDRAELCVFLGFDPERRAYRLWSMGRRTVVSAVSVAFDQHVFPFDRRAAEEANLEVGDLSALLPEREGDDEDQAEVGGEEGEWSNLAPIIPPADDGEEIKESSIVPAGNESLADPAAAAPAPVVPSAASDPGEGKRYPTRTRVKPSVLTYGPGKGTHGAITSQVATPAVEVKERVPADPVEAKSMPNGDRWLASFQREFDALTENDTWDLEPPSSAAGAKVLTGKWHNVIKPPTTKRPEELYKSRWVVRGFEQTPGVDYHDTFAPVAGYVTVRLVLAIAASLNLILHGMDAIGAFLQGEVEDVIYVMQPIGFEVKGKENFVCRLKKSLYGLATSPRVWWKALDKFLTSIGFTRSEMDPCLYFRRVAGLVLLVVFVDDLIIAASTLILMEEIKNQLSQRFKMKDEGALQSFLGMTITCTDAAIVIDLGNYSRKLLQKLRMDQCRATSTPSAPGLQLSKEGSPVGNQAAPTFPYRTAVGGLLYLAGVTRPDLSYQASVASRFNSNPGESHVVNVKHALRYLRGTMNLGITFPRGKPVQLVAYADAGWAADVDTRKSQTGWVIYLAGAPVSWKSTLQSCHAMSTAEAELYSLDSASREVVGLRSTLEELGFPQETTPIFQDNQAAIAIASGLGKRRAIRHVALPYLYVRDLVANKTVSLHYIASAEMVADLLTKATTKAVLEILRSKLLGPIQV